jgi:predicted MFS family arabinose efflux permease
VIHESAPRDDRPAAVAESAAALRRIAVTVGALLFVDTMCFAVLAPLLPGFEHEFGMSKATAGFLASTFALGTLVGALPAGALAAARGPRSVVLTGLALFGGASAMFGLAHDIAVLDIARFAQGVAGACVWAGGFAWLVRGVPPERRGQVIGTALSAATAGSLCGPALGAIAQATSRAVVFSSIVVISVALAVAVLRLPPPQSARQEVRIGRALRQRPVIAISWLIALPAAGFGVVMLLGPLRLADLGASGTAIAATFFIAAAIQASLSPIVGRASDRLGRWATIRGGVALFAVLGCLFSLPQEWLPFAILTAATSVSLGTLWGPAMAMLSETAEAVDIQQGVAFGLMNFAWAGGQVVGASGGGVLAQVAGEGAPLIVVAALACATLAVGTAWSRRTPPPAGWSGGPQVETSSVSRS